MERAAKACSDWLTQKFHVNNSYKIFSGKGNNGGDGLAIARMLLEKKFKVSVHIVGGQFEGSTDFQVNLDKLKKLKNDFHFL